jgi:trehalose-phosphatase
MKHLFEETSALKRILDKEKVLLMLDYDGTVVPIAKTPAQAVLSGTSRKIFEKAAGCPLLRLAFISGRSLSEIKKMAAIEGISYAGNHGLEIEGPGIGFVHKKAQALSGELRALFAELSKKLCDHKGVLVEDKDLSISVHFRLADPSCEKRIISEVTDAVNNKKFRLSSGKKVIEIRPRIKWNKGNAAKVLMRRFKGYYPVYLGDDRTDEDAFSALKKKGLTIFVGQPKKTLAAYCLKDHKEVRSLVKMIEQRNKKR